MAPLCTVAEVVECGGEGHCAGISCHTISDDEDTASSNT